MEQAENAIKLELDKIKNDLVKASELQKVKNKTESMMAFEDISLINRANSLATYELLGDADLMNQELERYQAVTEEDIQNESRPFFLTATAALYITAVQNRRMYFKRLQKLFKF